MPDGVYLADFETDNSMFRVSEACNGKGTLTVKQGNMTIHVSLGSKNIKNLYLGSAKDAAKTGAKLLEPTLDSVTYRDGYQEEVFGFDIPVPALNQEFSLALIGKKGKWYDHKVTVSNPERLEASEEAEITGEAGLVYQSSMELQFAENFHIDYYEGGYALLSTMDGTKLLTIPEGKPVPKQLDEDIIVMQQPVKNLYLVASGIMDMFCELDALDAIRLSGQKEDDWYLKEAKAAMAQGDILYAGKYNQPDYERIVSEQCSLAIENRMITHAPEVVEKLQSFGIPVLIDYSTYEKNPLGRVEWIRFFGTLLGKEKQAEKLFSEQVKLLKQAQSDEKTEKTVGFFFITADGMVQVRTPSDYVVKMIELAGGAYIFDALGDEAASRSTMNIQMEEFYETAGDADYLIYNSSIDGGVETLDELLDKSSLLADFKAVKEGNIWCTASDFYQRSMAIAPLIQDMHQMLQGDAEEAEMNYLFRIK